MYAACIYVIFIYPSTLPLYKVVRGRTDGYDVSDPGVTGILFCCRYVEIPVLLKNYQTVWRHPHLPAQGSCLNSAMWTKRLYIDSRVLVANPLVTSANDAALFEFFLKSHYLSL